MSDDFEIDIVHKPNADGWIPHLKVKKVYPDYTIDCGTIRLINGRLYFENSLGEMDLGKSGDIPLLAIKQGIKDFILEAERRHEQLLKEMTLQEDESMH